MQLRGTLMLLGAAFFWGTTFVAQLEGMDGLGPFSYAAGRYLVGFLSLVVLLIFTRRSRAKERRLKNYRRGFAIGLIIGVVLFIASSMQQVALQYSTAGKAAFINNSARKSNRRGLSNRRLIPVGNRRRLFNPTRRRDTFYQRVFLDGAYFNG